MSANQGTQGIQCIPSYIDRTAVLSLLLNQGPPDSKGKPISAEGLCVISEILDLLRERIENLPAFKPQPMVESQGVVMPPAGNWLRGSIELLEVANLTLGQNYEDGSDNLLSYFSALNRAVEVVRIDALRAVDKMLELLLANQHFKREVERLRTEILRATRDNAKVVEGLKKEIAERAASEDVEALKKTTQRLQRELDESEKRNVALRAEVNDKSNECLGLKGKLATSQSEIEKLKKGIEDLPGYNSAEIGELRAEVDSLRKEVFRRGNALASANENFNKIRFENGQLKMSLEDRGQASEDVASLRAQVGQPERERAELSSDNQRLLAEIKRKNTEIAELQTRNAALLGRDNRTREFVAGIERLLKLDRFARRDMENLLIVLRSNSSAPAECPECANLRAANEKAAIQFDEEKRGFLHKIAKLEAERDQRNGFQAAMFEEWRKAFEKIWPGDESGLSPEQSAPYMADEILKLRAERDKLQSQNKQLGDELYYYYMFDGILREWRGEKDYRKGGVHNPQDWTKLDAFLKRLDQDLIGLRGRVKAETNQSEPDPATEPLDPDTRGQELGRLYSAIDGDFLAEGISQVCREIGEARKHGADSEPSPVAEPLGAEGGA